MLRRYHRLSVEVGRLPSLLGRDFVRTRVTSYHAGTFEDAVIFVHDVARGLAKLVGRRFPEALDRLIDIFLEAGLLVRLPATDVAREKMCQEGKTEETFVNDSEHWE